MKYWGRCLLVYVTITAVLYGTNSVQPSQRSVSHTRRRGQEDAWPQERPFQGGYGGGTLDAPVDVTHDTASGLASTRNF